MHDAGKQTEKLIEATLGQQRAWVGPYAAKIETPLPLSLQEDWVVSFQYQNTGREPARYFTPSFGAFIASAAQFASGDYMKTVQKSVTDCKNTWLQEPSEVVYPITSGLGGAGYMRRLTLSKMKLFDVMEGNRVLVIPGCFVYETLGQTRHSTFCYFFKGGFSKPDNLNICPGASAD
jgi:hypothetical protein